jgi:Cyclin M transmembrane N-terminal domain
VPSLSPPIQAGFLSTVQVGITLVGVLSGAFSGATLGLRLADRFVELGLRTSVAEAVGVALVVAIITYFSLVIGELVPMQIGLRDPEKIAVRVAPAMMALARIASPIVSFLDLFGRTVLRALGYEAQPERRVSDEEIRSLMAEAETAGVLEPGERAMIAAVMRLGDRPRCRRSAAIIRLPDLCSVSMAICRRSAKVLPARVGVSRSSILTGAALIKFWLVALPPGDGGQRSSEIEFGAKRHVVTHGYANPGMDLARKGRSRGCRRAREQAEGAAAARAGFDLDSTRDASDAGGVRFVNARHSFPCKV